VKSLAVAALGIAALAGARGARELAVRGEAAPVEDAPYAPSAGAAPFVSIGYRELFADLMWVRLRGYFGGDASTAAGIADLAMAVAASDPHFKPVYEKGALAITADRAKVDTTALLRALDLLEQGMRMFPDDWKLPLLAGQTYLIDLQTTDPDQRREWDEKGALLLESAVRKPFAPQAAATIAATVRTKLGQQERAIQNLRELAMVSTSDESRRKILEKIAEIEKTDVAVIAAEIDADRRSFERRWQAERPAISATNYVVIGAKLAPSFDLGDLATGGRDVIEPPPEELPPLTD
jgi:hypothetical protein